MNPEPTYVDSSSLPDSSGGQIPTYSEIFSEQKIGVRLRTPLVHHLLVGGAGLLLATSTIAGLRAALGSSPEAPPVETVAAKGRSLPVETIEIEQVSAYGVPRVYTGQIVALRSSELGFERGGAVVEIMADEGDRVSAGEPVARLDTQNLETQRLQIEAQKAQAQARLSELKNGARSEDVAVAQAAVRDLEQQLKLQETQRSRREYLFEQGAIAQEQLDEFSVGADSLRAQLDQARSQLLELQNGTRPEQLAAQQAVVNQLDAQLQDIDVSLSKSTITAPFDGMVASRKADEGTVMSAGQSVLEFAESAVPEAHIGLPPAAANQVQVGSTQTVRVNDQPYSAQVTAVLPTVDLATRTQTVVLQLDSAAAGDVEPGQTARLTLNETVQAEGYWLPAEALTQGIRGLWTCYVLVPSGSRDTVVEQRSVEIVQQESVADGSTVSGGVASENALSTRVLVRGTLQPGDRVVTSGVHRLVPGQSVSAVPKG